MEEWSRFLRRVGVTARQHWPKEKPLIAALEKHGPPNILDNSSSGNENKHESKKGRKSAPLCVFM